jgi:4-amino-4-deoxyprephenate dehydrogenase
MTADRPTYVIGGAAGAIGRSWTPRLAADADVIGADLCSCASLEGAIEIAQLDLCQPGDERSALIGRADAVMICLPEGVALRIVDEVLDLMRPGALWVDTLSVTTPIVARLTSQRCDVEALSINPLFGPSVAPRGQCVLAVPVREGPRSRAFCESIVRLGASVERLSAEEHDRHTSAIQVLAHATLLAFGRALQALRYDLLDRPTATTPTMRTLLALLARMSSLSPDVYWDIQRANPYAVEARAALMAAAEDLGRIVGAADQTALHEFGLSGETILGEMRTHYQDLCARLFSIADNRTNGSS